MGNVRVSTPYVECPLDFEADTWPCDNFLQSTGGLSTYCFTPACRVFPHRYLLILTSITVIRGHVHDDKYSSTRKIIPVVIEIAPTLPSIQILIICPT